MAKKTMARKSLSDKRSMDTAEDMSATDSGAKVPRSAVLGAGLVLTLCLLALVAFLGWHAWKRYQAAISNLFNNAGIIQLKPGPWGNLGYVPITIAAPYQLLNVRKIEETPVKWYFEGLDKN